ncbi:MAG: replication-associated recombination protein A [Acholeplasmatales bacterium]|jgi:putative ATPase|nr:replication-associated recombination protein A [Acholeplasmatales bacterium]
MEPLASKLRPTKFEDILGEEHLIGKNGILTNMINKKSFFSFILYGPPGCGKTTIAKVFANSSKLEFFIFNASTDNKATLKSIIETSHFYEVLLIIDEIHRMKSDVLDYLLPFMENGKIIVIGLTTSNPYMAINIAIRSRCHIYEVKKLSDSNIKDAIKRAIKYIDRGFILNEDGLNTIVRFSNSEIRTALNIVEGVSLVLEDNATITPLIIRENLGLETLDLDDSDTHYYELLSALQKSIRGSDVDAALHYLARLITLGDLKSILRRLMVIAYEDIGLANPMMGVKMQSAAAASLELGFPEARIPLSVLVIEMSISPKSNSAITAIDTALEYYTNNDCGPISKNVDNKKIKLDPSIYHYPHNDSMSINSETYLPKNLKDKVFYFPKDETVYEKALKERLEMLDKLKNKRR